jgi:hypothetical protein
MKKSGTSLIPAESFPLRFFIAFSASSSVMGFMNIVSESVFNFNYVMLYVAYTSLFCFISFSIISVK